MSNFKLSDLIKSYSEKLKEESGDFSQATEENIGDLTVKDLRNYYAEKQRLGKEITDKDLDLLSKAGWATAREVMDILPKDAVSRFERVFRKNNENVSVDAKLYGHSKDNIRSKKY